MSRNVEIIREFIGTWSSLDAEKLAGFFTEDGCYHNMPLQPVRGRDSVQGYIKQFIASWKETEWEIISIAETEDGVIVERLDHIKTTAGDVDLPCVGVFEMEAGRIKSWRDYFDMATYMTAGKRGVLNGSVPSTGSF